MTAWRMVDEEKNHFAYKRDGLWQHGNEYAEIGRVLHWGGVPCVVVSFDDTEIVFAAPIGGPVMDITGGRIASS